jgi:hypothetical protein
MVAESMTVQPPDAGVYRNRTLSSLPKSAGCTAGHDAENVEIRAIRLSVVEITPWPGPCLVDTSPGALEVGTGSLTRLTIGIMEAA